MDSSITAAVQAAKRDIARRDLASARRRLEAFSSGARSDEANYVLGDTCIAQGDFAAAIAAYAGAFDWLPQAKEAAFKSGYALGRLSRWEEAGAALTLACRRGDVRGETMRGIGECARELVATGRAAPDYPLPRERAGGKLSIVVCSIRPERLQHLRENLAERLASEDWELIAVTDARSLCEGYTRGIARARGELLVFCHDDVRIVSPDFAAKLRAYLAEYELIGIAGTTRATGPSWGWSGPPDMYCWVSQSCITAKLHDLGPVTLLMGAHGPVVPNAQLLDGVFLAAHRALVERIGFDADTFDKFHFYDLDFSYRAFRAGARTAICLDISLFHDSAGNYGDDYWNHAQRFRAKFPEACTQAKHAVAAIPWMPLASSDAQLLDELAWVRHWVSRSDAQLRDQVLASAAAERSAA
jgi:hypothetical protein